MRPDDQNNRRVGTPLIPQRSFSHTQSPLGDRDTTKHNAAAANIARSQLDDIFGGNTAMQTPQTTPIIEQPTESNDQPQPELFSENPYERTQQQQTNIQPDQWKQYHSAWQDYYQKYYERYYVGQVHQAKQALEAKAKEATTAATPLPTSTNASQNSFSKNEALHDLRGQLLEKIQTSAQKARKSRHFVPITAALCVMLVFIFLQYNRMLFANVQAYISPGNIDPANIIIDPTTELAVNPEPKLIIPKINVDVPVIYNTTPDHNAQMKAMESGVAYFGIPGANSKPGQVGNTVFSGHSSNDVIDQGEYKFIFARLDQLANGDTIYANYEGKRYTYTITKKEVVKPTEVSKLIYPTDKPVITLITCTPLGTALNRLLVTAEQVSPSPKEAIAAPAEPAGNQQSAAMPGNSPTFLQRLFGGGDS